MGCMNSHVLDSAKPKGLTYDADVIYKELLLDSE